jgi:hypothetical protein
MVLRRPGGDERRGGLPSRAQRRVTVFITHAEPGSPALVFAHRLAVALGVDPSDVAVLSHRCLCASRAVLSLRLRDRSGPGPGPAGEPPVTAEQAVTSLVQRMQAGDPGLRRLGVLAVVAGPPAPDAQAVPQAVRRRPEELVSRLVAGAGAGGGARVVMPAAGAVVTLPDLPPWMDGFLHTYRQQYREVIEVIKREREKLVAQYLFFGDRFASKRLRRLSATAPVRRFQDGVLEKNILKLACQVTQPTFMIIITQGVHQYPSTPFPRGLT